MTRTLGVLALIALVACGGKSDEDSAGPVTGSPDATGTGTGTGTGGATGTGTGAATGTGTGTGAATGTGTGTGAATGTGTGTGTGTPSAMTAALTANNLYIDCMPVVGPDPVHGSFDASYDNGAGVAPDSATIASSELVMTNALGNQLTWVLTMNPLSSGTVPAGATTSVTHNKVLGAGLGDPCSFCGQSWDLNVTWNIGGQPVSDSVSGTVYCVF